MATDREEQIAHNRPRRRQPAVEIAMVSLMLQVASLAGRHPATVITPQTIARFPLTLPRRAPVS